MVRIMQFFQQSVNYFVAIIIFLLTSNVFAVTISVKTDRNPVVINESFQMIFEADGSVDDDPDFSPLNKDFQVLSTSVSSNMSIINGKISSTKQWQLTVLARREGKLTIPAISFGKDSSKAVMITAARSRSGSGKNQNSDKTIFVEVEANNLKPRVQSQILYTVKLYRSVNIANASLSDPEVSGGDAVIERLGEDQSYDTWIEGRRYIVVERNYAIYPQVSESLTIAPIRFQGQMTQDRFSMFDPFGSQAKTVIRQSEPITLDVQAIPNAFAGGHWLPSKNVSLLEEWSANPTEFRVGEPITRTLILTAEGQTASQLPELPLWSLPGFKQYPDQPSLSDDKTQAGITGTRQEKTAIIPNKPGSYTLPEIKLPWWNTASNRLEYAELPERKIVVLGVVNGTNNTPDFGPPAIGDIDLNSISSGSDSVATEPAEFAKTGSTEASSIWQYTSLGLGLAWFITLFLWWRSKTTGINSKQEDSMASSIRLVRKDIKRACQGNDAEKVKEHLLQWARIHWPNNPPMSIGEIGKRGSERLADEIRLLSNSLYSANQQSWDGSSFWVVFEKESFEKQEEKQNGKLEPLYKL